MIRVKTSGNYWQFKEVTPKLNKKKIILLWTKKERNNLSRIYAYKKKMPLKTYV